MYTVYSELNTADSLLASLQIIKKFTLKTLSSENFTLKALSLKVNIYFLLHLVSVKVVSSLKYNTA